MCAKTARQVHVSGETLVVFGPHGVEMRAQFAKDPITGRVGFIIPMLDDQIFEVRCDPETGRYEVFVS